MIIPSRSGHAENPSRQYPSKKESQFRFNATTAVVNGLRSSPRWGAWITRAAVFGSQARGTAGIDSDVDLALFTDESYNTIESLADVGRKLEESILDLQSRLGCDSFIINPQIICQSWIDNPPTFEIRELVQNIMSEGKFIE